MEPVGWVHTLRRGLLGWLAAIPAGLSPCISGTSKVFRRLPRMLCTKSERLVPAGSLL